MVPLDPDSAHDESLSLAESLAKSFHAELRLLSVVPTFSTLTGGQAAASSLMPATAQAFLDIREENASKHLQEHVQALRRKKLNASAEVARGDPAPIIVKTAEQSGCDLIILSTHGKAGIGAFWERSVAPSVAQRTRIPLLLIPLSSREGSSESRNP